MNTGWGSYNEQHCPLMFLYKLVAVDRRTHAINTIYYGPKLNPIYEYPTRPWGALVYVSARECVDGLRSRGRLPGPENPLDNTSPDFIG